MVIFNCKLMFSSKPLHLMQSFSTELFNIKIEKKRISSTISLQIASKNKSSKQKILNSISQSEISTFLDRKQLPLLTPLFKSSKHFKIFYKFVLNYNVAKDIVNKILPHISKTDDIVVEANPGLGLITLCLINSNIPKVIILDKSEITSIAVNQLIKFQQERFETIKVNLFKCPGLLITNLIDKSVKLNSSTKVIGVITNNTFLINLMHTYIINELWDKIHYLEYFLVVSSTVWKTIITYTSNDFKRYLHHSLFNFMFKIETLGMYPNDAFFPVASNDKGDMTLVRITANSELIKKISKNDLKNYYFFLDILSRNKQTFIIPTLEKFAPGCGPYLISKGVSMSNIIRDFSPSECVILFNIFKKYKGYDIFKTYNFSSYLPAGYKVNLSVKKF